MSTLTKKIMFYFTLGNYIFSFSQRAPRMNKNVNYTGG